METIKRTSVALWVVNSELNQTMFSSIIIKNSIQWKQMQPSFFSAALQPGFMAVYGVSQGQRNYCQIV